MKHNNLTFFIHGLRNAVPWVVASQDRDSPSKVPGTVCAFIRHPGISGYRIGAGIAVEVHGHYGKNRKSYIAESIWIPVESRKYHMVFI